jgi:hypothetical protein
MRVSRPTLTGPLAEPLTSPRFNHRTSSLASKAYATGGPSPLGLFRRRDAPSLAPESVPAQPYILIIPLAPRSIQVAQALLFTLSCEGPVSLVPTTAANRSADNPEPLRPIPISEPCAPALRDF